MPVTEGNCQFLQAEMSLQAFFCFAGPTVYAPFLTAPCSLCLASHLSSLVDSVYLQASYFTWSLPSFPLLTLVGLFPLSSLFPVCITFFVKPELGPQHHLSTPSGTVYFSALFFSHSFHHMSSSPFWLIDRLQGRIYLV